MELHVDCLSDLQLNDNSDFTTAYNKGTKLDSQLFVFYRIVTFPNYKYSWSFTLSCKHFDVFFCDLVLALAVASKKLLEKSLSLSNYKGKGSKKSFQIF